MIIDRKAGITPNRYQSYHLRRTIGRRIGRADRDDMLRALLWMSEVRVASDLTAEWRELHRKLDRETTAAEGRRSRNSWDTSDQVGESTRAVAKDLADELWSERYEAREALKECERVAEKISGRLGMDHSDERTDLRAVLSVFKDQLQLANERLSDLLAKDKAQLHGLAELEQHRRALGARTGVTLEQLDKMDRQEFDRVIEDALERSGFKVTFNGPAVLEVSRGTGTGLVICANSQNPDCDQKIDVEQVVNVQRLAEEREVGTVLLVSNLRYFSHPAYRLLQELKPDITGIQRFELQRWIEWGMPLSTVVGSA
ncbi:restriction endonuclease [Streptomyces sp. NPDC002225]|uniref:restriction endonuclease n=1 Tax=Streptomyces sp. NPDC002225 TaxID=3154413 RepID=UPI0033307720